MCGIFALLNSDIDDKTNFKIEFMKGKKRGPEYSVYKEYLKFVFGFHRLAINGLNRESNQPIIIDNIYLICNGEIYNYKELYTIINIKPHTGSDCEVIIHLYKKYGIDQTLRMLDGVFSFILYDGRIQDDLSNNIYIARDPIGIRPLYVLEQNSSDKSIVGFASELKCLTTIFNNNNNNNNNENDNGKQIANDYTLHTFQPGTYSVFHLSNKVHSYWRLINKNIKYYIPTFSYIIPTNTSNIVNDLYFNQISEYLKNAVFKRCVTTERPIACLLSGGLDSSLICALVNEYYKKNNIIQPFETYSIGLKGSEDLKHAKIVSDYLGTKHTEIIVTEQEIFHVIPDVIYAIESYDTTTVRASLGNYLLGKYISKYSEAKVIFNGDGSDELCGGYLYMNHCPDDIEFDKEIFRLLHEIHLFDVLRSDKCISSHGLETRTPFLDKTFVNYYLSIPVFYRNHNNHSEQCEKYLLRNSFSKKYFVNSEGNQLLPDSILWRKKEAFSDGVSDSERSLFTILQEMISKKEFKEANIETEKYYYQKWFRKFFPNVENIIPHYWMPKYVSTNDPSARTLETYKNK